MLFDVGDAGEFLCAMAEAGERADVIFLDPPRAGSSNAFLNALRTLLPNRIVYISCNPKTMADNLKYMKYYGYECVYLKPFDNFPLTKHIESIALLRKK